ncbi:MAG: ABC transporter permease [Clostridia bacterium]|nr:ABC transporter permease [Clostridia bacterium]
MRKSDFIKMGIKNLWRRKLRTILTMVGVMIGAFSIIVMVSLGIAMSKNFEEEIMQMGSLTTITVSKYYYGDENMMSMSSSTYTPPKQKELDDSLVAKIKKLPHVQAVTPINRISAKLKSGKYESWIDIQGIDPSTLEYFNFPEAEEGRLLTPEDTIELLVGADSCYFYNPNAGYTRWNDESPVDIMNDKIEIAFDLYNEEDRLPTFSKAKIIGKMVATGNEKDWNIYANIEQVEKWKKDLKRSGTKTYDDAGYSSILVSVDNVKNVEQVQKTIKDWEYGASSLVDALKPMQETSNTLQLILGGIGAISLLVSAIGIANTMIMSIYERTKEIGVMKVLGCLISDIRKLFLFEAAMIGFFGGVAGILLSYLASYLLNKYGSGIGEAIGGIGGGSGKISVIPLWLVLLSLGFSVFVGIVSGYYPARRATKIKALEAMRE